MVGEHKNSEMMGGANLRFALKRRSAPSAAFAEIVEALRTAVRDDPEMAEAVEQAVNSIGGVALSQEKAERLKELDQLGTNRLGVDVAAFPHSMGPGFVLLYDATLEALRSTAKPINLDFVNAQSIRELASSMERFVSLTGDATLTALDLALADDQFANRLSERANEIVATYLDDSDPAFGCGPDECVAYIQRSDGTVEKVCLPEGECGVIGGSVVVFITVGLVIAVVDWIIDLF
jgi:hypothetical protein